VEAHAAGCAECAAALAGLRATRAAMASLPPLPAPERGEAVLLAAARQAAEAARERRTGLLPRWFWGAVLGAASAATALLVTLQLSGAPTASRFDEGREALAGRGEAPAPAAPPASAAAARDAFAPPPASAPASQGLLREAERGTPALAKAEAPPAGPGGAAGRGEAGVEGVEDGAVASRERVAPSVPRPTPAAAPAGRESASADAPPPALARKAASDVASRAGPLEAPADDVRPSANQAEAKAAAPRAAAAPPAASAAPQPSGLAAPAARRAEAACPGERTRALERDEAGRLVRRVRAGRLAGLEYRAEERFGADGRLSGATLAVDGRAVALRPGDLEPIPGLRLAPTAAAAEAAPPACGP
jgi:hypothetical protein